LIHPTLSGTDRERAVRLLTAHHKAGCDRTRRQRQRTYDSAFRSIVVPVAWAARPLSRNTGRIILGNNNLNAGRGECLTHRRGRFGVGNEFGNTLHIDDLVQADAAKLRRFCQ